MWSTGVGYCVLLVLLLRVGIGYSTQERGVHLGGPCLTCSESKPVRCQPGGSRCNKPTLQQRKSDAIVDTKFLRKPPLLPHPPPCSRRTSKLAKSVGCLEALTRPQLEDTLACSWSTAIQVRRSRVSPPPYMLRIPPLTLLCLTKF